MSRSSGRVLSFNGPIASYILFATVAATLLAASHTQAGVIKDLFQKISSSSNKSDDSTVQESVPICGNGLFSSPNQASLSPEFVFITNRAAKSLDQNQPEYGNSDKRRENQNSPWSSSNGASGESLREVAKEFRFHAENVTLEQLERRGFNRDAPVTFLIHGFTSGYPLQAWMSAIVESNLIDRTNRNDNSNNNSNRDDYSRDTILTRSSLSNTTDLHKSNLEIIGHLRERLKKLENDPYLSRRREERRNSTRRESSQSSNYDDGEDSRRNRRNVDDTTNNRDNLKHNLFIVNWNYAARGINYPRAVANIPIVATYVTRFINEKLLDEANVNPDTIQLVGHSLGAHLAGFIGKNTRQKVGRIYGLDPAGPCFGTISGPLYPSSKRLAPSDAKEVISIHTNSALLGIDKPLGKYSVFVEGGAAQPGCKGGGVLKSVGALTTEGADFDKLACSHSRAPNLFAYKLDQTDSEDDCQMVAYGCDDWHSFVDGKCGICRANAATDLATDQRRAKSRSPLEPVDCKRIGLEWQYSLKNAGNRYNNKPRPSFDSYNKDSYESVTRPPSWNNSYNKDKDRDLTTSRRPRPYNESYSSSPSYDNIDSMIDSVSQSSYYSRRSSTTSRRPSSTVSEGFNFDRNKRAAEDKNKDKDKDKNNNNVRRNSTERRQDEDNDNVQATKLFLRTSDTQPYCTFHYQVILELNKPFERSKPPMAIILQDSDSDEPSSSYDGSSYSRRQRNENRRTSQNSLSDDAFGNKFDDTTYTHLLTSDQKLKQIDHATLIFREGLKNGHNLLNKLHVNYMSHSDPEVRRRLSSQLCITRTETDRRIRDEEGNRFYFRPC